VTVNAQVDFAPAANNTQVWAAMDGGTAKQMTANATLDSGGHQVWTVNFDIPSESGRHTFTLSWHAGPGNSTTDFNGGNPLQATYSALSDNSDPPDDSGPVTQAAIGDNTGAIAGVDSIATNSSKTLTVAFRLQGLELAQPGDKPIVLRTAVQNNKKTGAIDCGQGTGAQGLHDAIVSGCPDPVAVYDPNQGCVSLPTTPLTCAGVVPGNRRQQTVQAFQDRVNQAVFNAKASPCDAWQTFRTGTPISGFEPWDSTVPDPRIVVFIVTTPGDLSGNSGSTAQVKILGFSTFYITGWDGDPWLPNGNGNGGQKIPNCSAPTNQDEAYPFPNQTDKFQIWGHFIKYVALGGTPNGNPCNPNDPATCVAALTR
jgi:hypothetical protein